MPPRIAEFDFGPTASNFGDSASVQCLVTSGDLPIEFRWLYNLRPVSEIAGITTAKMGKRNSVLTIDSVTEQHVGNFTCRATSNSVITVNYTAELIVNGIYRTKVGLSLSKMCSLLIYGLFYTLKYRLVYMCFFYFPISPTFCVPSTSGRVLHFVKKIIAVLGNLENPI